MSEWKKRLDKVQSWHEERIVDENGIVMAIPVNCSADDIIREHNAHKAMVDLLKSLLDHPYGLKMMHRLSEHACEGMIRDTWLPKIDAVLAQAEGSE